MDGFLQGALAMLLLLQPVQAATAATIPDGAVLAGTILDAGTSEPLPGAVVILTELERAAFTGLDGRYSLSSVPPGPHHITIRLIGYAPRTLHALAPRNGVLEINVSLKSQPLRIRSLDVRAPVSVRGLDFGDSASFPDRESSIAAIRNHPLLTEPDVFQGLEGAEVVLQPETPSGVHVRGAAADHLAYRIDGVPVFSPYHAAGMSSAWNPDALSRLRLSSSGSSEGDPNSLAGALEAVTLAPGENIRAQGSVSTTQARVTLDGPLGAAGAGFLLSARAGFAGLLTHKTESSHLRGETGDWLAKLEMPAIDGRLRLLGYDSKNEIDAAATPGSAVVTGSAGAYNSFDWRSRSWGAEWRRTFSNADLRLLGWTAQGNAGARWNAEAGPVRLSADRRDVGILADVEHRTPRATILAGLRFERANSSYRVVPDSASQGAIALQARTPVASAFGQIAWRIGSRVELGVGTALAATERELYPSPRATLRWEGSKRLSLTGSFARSHQFAQSLRNAESVVGTIFPYDLYLGAPEVPVALSDQGVIAADYRPAAGMRLTLQAYARGSDRLALVAPRSGEPFSLGSFAVGSGTSRGITLDGAMNGAHYGIVASYGAQRVRLAYGDSSYVPEHGTKQLFQGGIILFPTSTLSLRLGGDAAWGRRTTTASGEFEWEACNLLDRGCEFGGSPHYNGETLGGTGLPPYYRLDFGVRQHWHFTAGGRDVSMALFAALTNILGRKNVLTYARNPSNGQITAIEMRPRAPLVIGLDWKF